MAVRLFIVPFLLYSFVFTSILDPLIPHETIIGTDISFSGELHFQPPCLSASEINDHDHNFRSSRSSSLPPCYIKISLYLVLSNINFFSFDICARKNTLGTGSGLCCSPALQLYLAIVCQFSAPHNCSPRPDCLNVLWICKSCETGHSLSCLQPPSTGALSNVYSPALLTNLLFTWTCLIRGEQRPVS